MQNPDNNMDELFRKAAESYSLKTDMPDWDDIAPALSSTPLTSDSPIKGKRKIMGLFLLGFILLAGSSLSIHFYNKANSPSTSVSSDIKNSLNKRSNVNALQDNRATASGVKVEVEQPIRKIYYEQKVNSIAGITSIKIKEAKPVADNYILAGMTNSNYETIGETFDSQERININGSSKTAVLNNIDSIENKAIVATDIKINAKDIIQKLPIQLTQDKKKNNKEHGIYFGLLAGTQLSQVKGQGFKNPGLNIGAIAGYRLNNKISVEGGLIYSKEKYYSDGKYFDPAKTGTVMATGMKIVSLQGESSVIEIPVKIKYDLLRKGQSGWFVSGGVSSSVLLNENNDYATLLFGSPQNMEATYHQKKGYFISAVNISTGYEFKAFNNSSIRVEPFVQIPIKGIGVGAMPVFNTGLNFVITLPGFR